MSKSEEVARMGSNPPLVLEGASYVFHDLITIKSDSEYKREIVEKVRTNLALWMRNPHFNEIGSAVLDIALVVRVNANRMKIQDVDNIAKVVLDALKKDDGDSRFLFHDDKQIVRLLIYKEQSQALPGYNTDSLTISFRVHDSKKQMILVNPVRM